MKSTRKPNIVFVLADDLGYGDVSCLNPDGKISTPRIDGIARQGVTFTDAHAAASICSPSRYSVLTGRYAWRSPLPHGIVGVYGETILPPTRMTVANLLKAQGYDTACFGKWHLGMGWNRTGNRDEQNDLPELDFAKPVTAGPTSNGFDTYFGVDVPNWPPYCFIENKQTVGTPTGTTSSGTVTFTLSNEEISIHGPRMEGWKLENLLPTITDRACAYITEKAKGDKPFFIYYPLTSPHTPLAVNEPWKGKSGLNAYADFVMETDAMVGRLLDTLEEAGVAENTLFVFMSDNGFAHYVGADFLEARGHFPSYIYRGYKSDVWDGGHRIPCMVRWPGVVEPGRTYDHLISLADLFRTVADITGGDVPDSAAEDSVSLLSVLEGAEAPVRDLVVSQSFHGKFTITKGGWKLILGPASGGFSANVSDADAEARGLPKYQLYDLKADPRERNNLYPERMDVADELKGLLEELIKRGRSTPGKPQKNDLRCVSVDNVSTISNHEFVDDWLTETN